MRKPVLLLTVVGGLSLSSCQFGDSAEEMMTKYNDVERELSFSFSSYGPGASTRINMTDGGLTGLSTKWDGSESLALFDFGQCFREPTTPVNMAFASDEEDLKDLDFAQFTGSAKAKMGENVFNEKSFALVYPYGRFKYLSNTETSVSLDFTGQDGTLLTLQDNFVYAWGSVKGICEDAEVTLYEGQAGCSSDLDWHSHETMSENIILDNKMCIIRFSLIGGTIAAKADGTGYDTAWSCLTDYLASQSTKLSISSIDVQNTEEYASGFSKVSVDLHTGLVTSDEEAANVLTVTRRQPFREISYDLREANTADIDEADQWAWGTTFYLSVPCPMLTTLPFHPLLTIHTVDDSGNPGTTYYGALSTKKLREGNYYMTAPIKVYDSKMKLQEEAKIYLYYHSSYVFDTHDID